MPTYTLTLARDVSEYAVLTIKAPSDAAAMAEARALRDADGWTAGGTSEWPHRQRVVSLETESEECLIEDEMDSVHQIEAVLAAAAPQLLNALLDIVAASDANCGDSLANAINAARAAIAKATET